MKVKTFFHGWQELDKEQTLAWARHKFSGITTMSTDKKVDHINSQIKGISFTAEELKGEK